MRQSALNFPSYIKSFGDILLSRMHECSENCQHMPFVVVVRLRFKLKATFTDRSVRILNFWGPHIDGNTELLPTRFPKRCDL